MDDFDAEKDAGNTFPPRYSWQNDIQQTQNAADHLDSAFRNLGLGGIPTTQNTVGETSSFGGKEEDDEDEDEDDDARSHPNCVPCYGPKLCGYMARSSQAHDAARNADSIAHFLLSKEFETNAEGIC
jgi:hypothetical protein